MTVKMMLTTKKAMYLCVCACVYVTLMACSGNSTKSSHTDNRPSALKALEQTTHHFSKVWSVSTDALTGNTAVLLTPAWDDAISYVASENGVVTAIDNTSGKRLWKKDIKQPISAGLGNDIYQLYVVSKEGQLIALDKSSGEIAWEKQLQSAVLATPVSNNLVVVVHAVDGKVAGFDPYTGNSYWVHQENVPSFSIRGNAQALFVDNQWVVLGLDNGKVIGLRAQQGGLLWEKKVNQQVYKAGSSIITDIDLPVLYSNNSLLISTQSGELLAVDKNSGVINWQGNYDESIKYYAAEDQSIAVVSNSDKVFAHDVNTGELLWVNKELRYRKLSQPRVYGDYIYLVDSFGVLHLLSLKNGEIVARLATRLKTVSNAVKVQGNNVLIIDDTGKVLLLNQQAVESK